MADPRVLRISQGFDGWTPKLSVVSDGARRVLKLSGWTGGQGNPPQFDLYVGTIGYVTDIADAVNIAGEATAVQYQENGVDVGTTDVNTINFTGDAILTYASGTLEINIISAGGTVTSVNGILPEVGNVELLTGDIPDSLDARYVTDAQLVVIGNTSNTNTGDETQATIKTKLGAANTGSDGYLTSADWNTFNSKLSTAPTTFSDSAFRIQDNTDATKQIAFESSLITTGTTRTITSPNRNITLGITPDWVTGIAYKVGDEVVSSLQHFVCREDHTSSGSIDYVKFAPSNGIMEVAIASGTFTAYSNPDIKSYLIRATGSFAMNLANVSYSTFAQVINVNTSGAAITITSSQTLAEGHFGAATATPLTLSCGEGVSAYNLNNSSTTYYQRINSYKQPAALATFYKSGSQTVGATFDASALTAAKTITLPNGDVWLNELPQLYAISSGTLAWKTGSQTLKPSFIFASGSFTIDTDLVPTNGVVPFDIVNTSTGTITVTLTASFAFSSSKNESGTTITSISLLAGERATCTTYDSGSATWYFRKQGAFSSNAYVLYDGTTPSKRLTHNIASIAASTTRTVTWPDANVNIGKVTGYLTAVSNLTVGASPFTYQNTAVYQEDILITGGIVSLIEFTRDNSTWYTRTGDTVSLSPSDRVRVTYSSTPTMTKIPR